MLFQKDDRHLDSFWEVNTSARSGPPFIPFGVQNLEIPCDFNVILTNYDAYTQFQVVCHYKSSLSLLNVKAMDERP